MDDPAFALEEDLSTQSILLAAAHHDIAALRNLLRNSSANVQDTETGFTPLHAAIAACEPDMQNIREENGHANGDAVDITSHDSNARKQELEAAEKTVRFLFENGAIWNDLDTNDETPGCIARRLKLENLYMLCVDAGVRAELLLGRLDDYQVLSDDDSDVEAENETEDETPHGDLDVRAASATDATIDGAVQEDITSDESTKNPNYLTSTLTFDRNRILDGAANGVMMDWETKLMRKSAELLVPSPQEGLRVLNIGHGMGIIDSIFQEKSPKAHHIIEAHPDVLKQMEEQGWSEKSGVIIHEGRWQDVVPGLVERGELFDAIYFDTFAEEYKALREFFTEHVIGLLDPSGGADGGGGRFGFFNGMGADRQICYDVYNRIVEMDLLEAGFDTEWQSIEIPDLESQGEWDGVRRKYWIPDTYNIPTAKFVE